VDRPHLRPASVGHPTKSRIYECCENDRLRNNTGATFSSWEEDVAKLCCLFLLNGNRISQQRFMPEDLVQVVET
jgi:hypothetical protein